MYARRWTGESEKKGRKGERREREIGERRDGRIQWRGDIYIYTESKRGGKIPFAHC